MNKTFEVEVDAEDLVDLMRGVHVMLMFNGGYTVRLKVAVLDKADTCEEAKDLVGRFWPEPDEEE